jgi:hypothetical protein
VPPRHASLRKLAALQYTGIDKDYQADLLRRNIVGSHAAAGDLRLTITFL